MGMRSWMRVSLYGIRMLRIRSRIRSRESRVACAFGCTTVMRTGAAWTGVRKQPKRVSILPDPRTTLSRRQSEYWSARCTQHTVARNTASMEDRNFERRSTITISCDSIILAGFKHETRGSANQSDDSVLAMRTICRPTLTGRNHVQWRP
jgi:hypothetical protein